jgi:MerR family transcriptional regulator, light-induced transcriptional regulator
MDPAVATLEPDGLRRFAELRQAAVEEVTDRFLREHAAAYAKLGPRGREACREDLAFHLEFLQPVLEFGLLGPMLDYLRWLGSVLDSRGIPASHLPLSLEWLAECFEARLPARDGAIVAAALRLAGARMADRDEPLRGIYERLPDAWPECAAFEEALLAGDHRRATQVVDGVLDAGRGLVEAELHVIQPALYRIGQKWQENRVSVAQEHLATAIAQSVMARGMIRSEASTPNGRRVLLACVAGNHHAVGLQMVADSFELGGWDVQYLGADVPVKDLVAQACARKPDLVGLSVSFAHQLRVARQTIRELQSALGPRRPPVIIGGLAVNQFDQLAGKVGADGWSPDAVAAISSGAGLADAAA